MDYNLLKKQYNLLTETELSIELKILIIEKMIEIETDEEKKLLYNEILSDLQNLLNPEP